MFNSPLFNQIQFNGTRPSALSNNEIGSWIEMNRRGVGALASSGRDNDSMKKTQGGFIMTSGRKSR